MIPAEAVEAAAKVAFERYGAKPDAAYIRTLLKSAAPHMLRAAQEVAWAAGATSAGMNLMALQAAGINPNPYRAAAERGGE